MGARSISKINTAISPAHLRGIGQVAASWNILEIDVLIAISYISGIPHETVVALIKSVGFMNWLETLSSLVENNPRYSWNQKKINSFIGKVQVLYGERNSIVHAYWFVNSDWKPPYLLSDVAKIGKPKKIAEGFSIKKRGTKLYTHVSKSAVEMRKVATRIRAASKELEKILDQPAPKHVQKLIGLAQLAAYNQAQNLTTEQSTLAALMESNAASKKS